MNRSLRKNALRTIKDSLGRYLAIFAIIALGAGLFIGLRLSRPDFLETLQQYMDETHFFDFRLVSTLGLTEDDVKEAQKLDGITDAEGAVSVDFLYKNEDGDDLIITANSIGQRINLVDVVEGRMPEEPYECLADPRMFGADDIGETINLSVDNSDDTLDSFAYKEFTIVGIAESVCYINRERGSSTLGNGSVAGYIYIPAEGFATDCYTDIYLTADTTGYIYSEEYRQSAKAYVQTLEDFMTRRALIRHDDIIIQARKELDEAKKPYEDGLKEYNDGYAEYAAGVAQFQSAKAETQAQLDEAYQQIVQAEAEDLDGKEAQLVQAQAQIQDGYSEYERGLRQYELQANPAYSRVNSQIDYYTNELASDQNGLISAMGRLSEIDAELETATGLRRVTLNTERAGEQVKYDHYSRNVATDQSRLQEALDSKATLDARLQPLKLQLDNSKALLDQNSAEVEAGLAQVREAKTQLAEGKKAYEAGKAEAERSFAQTQMQLDSAYAELQKAREKLDAAQAEIADAEHQIKDIENADTYVMGRESNIGYVCFESDTQVVDSVADVFPLFFLLVAALVCLTTMTRMISDERTQVGILKALGYTPGEIIGKYLFYSGTATALGCVAGIAAGSYLFPYIVWVGYSIMYSFSSVVFTMNWVLAAVVSGINIAAMLLVTWLCCRSELKSVAAELIRPKAPESGKRILLERVPAIWNRMSFMSKVSTRNVLRYKMRIFMMLLGIGGCTALILTGFGLKDTINNVVGDQYGEISLYDYELNLAYDMSNDAEKRMLLTDCGDSIDSAVFLYRASADIKTETASKSITLTATDEQTLYPYIDLHSGSEPMPYPGRGEVIINRNVAMLMGISVGDEIEISTADMDTLTLTVSGVFDNFVSNHAFVSLDTCREQWGYTPALKSALVIAPEGVDVRDNAARIARANGVRSMTLSANTGKTISNMMQSLDYVVMMIILCAGLLAFIVVYNLTNINISERIREIATIKVLGFYRKETANYVFRENLVLTGVGALFGLWLGVMLHAFVMSRIKVDLLYFEPSINILSYVLAIVITYVFAVIVNAIMNRRIDRIDMAGALKSVE